MPRRRHSSSTSEIKHILNIVNLRLDTAVDLQDWDVIVAQLNDAKKVAGKIRARLEDEHREEAV